MHAPHVVSFFFFNDTATTEIYTLSLHDALPISWLLTHGFPIFPAVLITLVVGFGIGIKRNKDSGKNRRQARSEEHTSELQSHSDLVCRLLLEKKKKETL